MEREKPDKILVLTNSKLNSMDSLVYQVLIDTEIRHEEFITVLNEKEKCEKMKEFIRMIKSSIN